MKKYLQAYTDVWNAGYVREESLRKHIESYLLMDKILPDVSSFFYVVKFPDGKYNFLGKQQESVSGYANEEFMAKGVQLFLESIHPEEIDIILQQVYPDITTFVASLDEEAKKRVMFQYNYRFRRKDGVYVNLLENVHILELDEMGRPGVVLGNIIMLHNSDFLPVRLNIKKFGTSEMAETLLTKVYSDLQRKRLVTERELEVLRYLATGKTSKEVGRQLFISPNTVDTHRRNLLKKLECKTVVELTQIAFQHALL